MSNSQIPAKILEFSKLINLKNAPRKNEFYNDVIKLRLKNQKLNIYLSNYGRAISARQNFNFTTRGNKLSPFIIQFMYKEDNELYSLSVRHDSWFYKPFKTDVFLHLPDEMWTSRYNGSTIESFNAFLLKNMLKFI